MSYNVLSYSHWGLGQFFGGVGVGVVKKGQSPDFRSPEVGISVFNCVSQILGSSSIHIFRLLFLSLSITFQRIHEQNSFDLGAIYLSFVSNFVASLTFSPHCYLMGIYNFSIKY